ncbi:MAG: DUF6263 family protein [Gemmatimonadaceae bacterium]
MIRTGSDAAGRHGRCILALAVAMLAGPELIAQPVSLRVRPHVGDTLRLRMEQESEMTVERSRSDTVTYRMSLLTLSRILVKGYDDQGTAVESIIDSVSMSSSTGNGKSVYGGAGPDAAMRALRGKRARMLFALDGAAHVLPGDPAPAAELESLMSLFPATLPNHPVSLGESWTQTMDIPLAGQTGTESASLTRVTFRLDSLTKGSTLAYISMRGSVIRDSSAAPLAQGVRMTVNGSITGMLLVDRKRGWLTDARTQMLVHSIFTPPAKSALQPMHISTRVNQRTRLADEK